MFNRARKLDLRDIGNAGQGDVDLDITARETELVPRRHMSTLVIQIMRFLRRHRNLKRLKDWTRC